MKARLEEALQFHQSALNLQARRQEMLASNIANADTPNYKARDIDFRSALAAQLGRPGEGMALAQTSAGHLPTGGAQGFEGYVGYRQELQSSADGNTVNMDVERAAFAENALHYEASLTFINGLLSGMRTAITGGQ
ncbi:flagellar basal body rod protein FlgB [Pseudazoarcus pumilus]|uniref:Flagellar basal body rod protein FlgB n=1 Tax=Pseudazoarcus pumilus TaxID=2067960 RepID=A0A2I6S8G8_9RHOO|nr:flagellar basal body rod protein FlgB [Pseudazoarcus pumilus]AUN95555.1 flagellar basal body rod protein FlgB [Pseudazoarcus pumilus]